LNVLDMRNIFESDGGQLGYHFKNDGHWNASGHKLAGTSLAEFISASLISK
jgi:hypothetical protein